jgi:hypothetical protein
MKYSLHKAIHTSVKSNQRTKQGFTMTAESQDEWQVVHIEQHMELNKL